MIWRALLLAQVCLACVTLEKLNSDVEGLRDGGNLNNAPHYGCNRMGCGSSPAGDRLKLKADELLSVESYIHKVWAGGRLKFELKYGENPDFDKTPGFEIEASEPLWIAKDTTVTNWNKNFYVEPKYNGPATIQVSFITDGVEVKGHPLLGADVADFEDVSSVFHQCIDIEITEGGLAFPEGDFANGFGPGEEDAAGGGFGTQAGGVIYYGSNPFWAVFGVLLFLVVICGALCAYLVLQHRKQTPMPRSEPIVQNDVLTVPDKPEPPRTEKTPTPEEEEEVAVGIHYEEADPTPQKEATPPAKLEATGSMGRHFHFRYVEDDDQEQ